MPDNDKLAINLLIGSQMHSFTVSRDKERLFREAAELINERYNKYRNIYQNQSTDNYNASVMLDIAVRYIQNQDNQDTTPFIDSMKALTQEIEEVLGEK